MQCFSFKNLINKNNFYFFLLSAFAAVIPFSKNWGDVFIFLTLIFWLVKYFSGEINFKKNLLSISVALILLSIIISFIYNFKIIQSSDIGIINQTQQTLSLISPFIFFFIISTIPITEKKIKWILFILLISTLSAVFYLLILGFKAPYLMANRLTINQNVYGPNTYGCFLAMIFLMVLIFTFFQRNKINILLGTIASFLIFLALIFTYSRGAWIGLIASVSGLFLYLNKWRKLLLLVLLVVLIILSLTILIFNHDFITRVDSIFAKDSPANTGRLILWNTSLKMISISPILGIGPNMFHYYFKKINSQQWDPNFIHAHNNFLTILIEEGWIGFIIFVILLIVIFYKILQWKNSTSEFHRRLSTLLISWLVLLIFHGMVDYIIWLMPFNCFMFLLGLSTSLETKQISST